MSRGAGRRGTPTWPNFFEAEPRHVFNEEDPHSPRLSFSVDSAPGGGAIGTATLTHF